MFYFKSIALHNAEKKDIETSLRKFSSKRITSLDFKSSASYTSSEKYFLGFETDTDFQITRIRTPFERFFPKLILNFPKDKQFTCYLIRYSFLSQGRHIKIRTTGTRITRIRWINFYGSGLTLEYTMSLPG